MLFFLYSFTLLSRLSLSNTVSNIACKIDEEELHYVFVPMHISAIPPMKKDLVMSAKRGLCHYKSFSCLTLNFLGTFCICDLVQPQIWVVMFCVALFCINDLVQH